MRIEKGKIFFHFNPKLCYSKINELLTYVDMPEAKNWDQHDVSLHTNGDKVACEVSTLKVQLWKVSDVMAIIEWTNYRKEMVRDGEYRTLLGYLIYYREA